MAVRMAVKTIAKLSRLEESQDIQIPSAFCIESRFLSARFWLKELSPWALTFGVNVGVG
jgi:hypothetical protein